MNERTFTEPERDQQHFLKLLVEMVDLFRMRLHVYLLMDNHYHC